MYEHLIEELDEESAIIVVDMQKDFITGTLAVPNALDIVVPMREFLDKVYMTAESTIYLTLDFHPEDHCSFIDNGGLWPKHCVAYTEGSELIFDSESMLVKDLLSCIKVLKGMFKDVEEYSPFGNLHLEDSVKVHPLFIRPLTSSNFNESLQLNRVKKLFIIGLATDYCVKETALDAVKLGYDVSVLIDLCKGVAPDTELAAIAEMEKHGVKILRG